MSQTARNASVFIPLTALWAFVESGLGGMMHALHLPFTGVVLGGFSLLIVCLLAHYEQPIWGQIMKATLIVLTVKAAVNPATPPTAYIAVAFQGLSGACLFAISRGNLFVCLVYGIMAMLESAFQKLLVLTLIFGTEWWAAVDAYFVSVTKPFGMQPDMAGSRYVIFGYLAVFAVWGVVLGFWMYHLPSQLALRATYYAQLKPVSDRMEAAQSVGFSWKKILYFVFPMLLLSSFFVFPNPKSGMQAFVWVLRTLAVVWAWWYVILPIWRYFLQKWLKKQRSSHQEMERVMEVMPQISQYVKPLYQAVSQRFSGMKRGKEFVLGLIVITLGLNNGE